MKIWRLNVRETQIGECIHHKKFAISARPKNPEIQKGDILLLQLVSSDAVKLDRQDARVEFALIFDHYEYDHDGAISQAYWPNAEKTWPWIMHCNEIVPTIPFSLENLKLQNNYAGQTNPLLISSEDSKMILPFLLRIGSIDEIEGKVRKAKDLSKNDYYLWALLQGNDRIVEDSPDEIGWITKKETREIKRNIELPIILKELYNYSCQICQYDFSPTYGVPYSETHHVVWLSRGGIDHSNNLIVVCPNHHRIIHEAKPIFDREKLTFVYENGLQETLQINNHLKDQMMLRKIEEWAAERRKKIIEGGLAGSG